MFRPMRRKKKETDANTVTKLLKTERRGVLAVTGDDGYPYAIPLNFYYDENTRKIYFHGAKEGYKADALRYNDKVCFTVYGNEQIMGNEWAPYVQSAVIFGRCRAMQPGAEAYACLRKIAMKYYPNEELAEEEIVLDGKAAQIYEITIEHMTGKQIQEK